MSYPVTQRGDDVIMQEKKPLNVAIGYRIQLSREQAGLTQEQLAERINRSTQFISTLERGLAGPSLETIINICNVLDISTEWVLRGRRSHAGAADLASAFTEKLGFLSPTQLELVDQLADTLVKLLQTGEETL